MRFSEALSDETQKKLTKIKRELQGGIARFLIFSSGKNVQQLGSSWTKSSPLVCKISPTGNFRARFMCLPCFTVTKSGEEPFVVNEILTKVDRFVEISATYILT